MVHALEEAWRILATSGILLNLLPIGGLVPLDVVTHDGAVQIGMLDESSEDPDLIATESAVQNVLAAGRFVSKGKNSFRTEYRWDTVEELEAYLSTRKHEVYTRPGYAELERKLEEFTQKAGAVASLRCLWERRLEVYEKMKDDE